MFFETMVCQERWPDGIWFQKVAEELFDILTGVYVQFFVHSLHDMGKGVYIPHSK